MKLANRYNKARKFSVDTTGYEYRKLADLFMENGAGAVYTVRGIYINTKTKFNDAPVIATDGFFVNLPSHMTETAREILGDNEFIDAINAGKIGFTVHEYTQKKYNRVCYGINFVDIE